MVRVFSARSRPPRVIHVVSTGSGGHWMYEILLGLRERGYDVGAIIASCDGDLAEKLDSASIPFWICDTLVQSPWDLAGISGKVLRLARLLHRLRPDVVQYHLFEAMVLGRAAAWLAGVPVRFSMITGPIYLEAPAPRKVDLRTIWMDTAVIASCRWVQTEYARLGVRKPVELVYYGADPRRFDPQQADGHRVRRELGLALDQPVVGMVAHFYPPLPPGPWTPEPLWNRAVKGHETFLEAVPLVLEQLPDARFLLVGKGWGKEGEAYERRIRALAREQALERVVTFTGFRTDIPDVLAALDVAVQCSRSENLGGTIEALLMGVPMVVTAVGGMVDAVVHEETGLLVPPDDPRALAHAICRLLQDRKWARQLGQNGRARALERFTVDRTVEDLDRLYRRELGRRVPPAPVRISLFALRSCRPVLGLAAVRMRASLGHLRTALRIGGGAVRRRARHAIKRALDIGGAFGLLVAFSPVMLGVGFLVWLTMGRPVLFAQCRAGLHGRPFTLWKFRTMTMDVDPQGRPLPDGQRLTPMGRFLRRTSLDELPQLFNVLRGDMSLVGPRPLPVEYLPHFTPQQATRQLVKPGITGLALVQGRNRLSWEERLKLDAWYAQHWTLGLDMKILLKTIWMVLKQEGINYPGHPTMPPFAGGREG